MKAIAALMFLFFLAIPAISQPPDHKGISKKNAVANTGVDKKAKDNHDDSAAPKYETTTVQQQHASSENGQNHQADIDEKVDVDRKLADFTKYLVWVGIGQLAVLFFQLLIFRRQAKLMKDHKTELESLAEAAKNNAKAALLNAQAIINSERPWISMFATHSNGVFTIKAANFGRTPAQILFYCVAPIFIDQLDNLPRDTSYGRELPPPLAFLVPAGDDPIVGESAEIDLLTYNVPAMLQGNSTREAEMRAGKVILVFLVRVVYRNTLSEANPLTPPHETKMCFWYSAVYGSDYTLHVGPNEWNQHT